jgi:hypothetical protein
MRAFPSSTSPEVRARFACPVFFNVPDAVVVPLWIPARISAKFSLAPAADALGSLLERGRRPVASAGFGLGPNTVAHSASVAIVGVAVGGRNKEGSLFSDSELEKILYILYCTRYTVR